MSVLLASGSPQRRAILTQLEVPFRVEVPDVEEVAAGDPVDVARRNARLKARAVQPLAMPGEVVIACDTLLDVDGEVWGKPVDRADAERMLRALAGRSHRVIGGASVVWSDVEHDVLASTTVRFREVSDEWLDRYLDGGEWQGRAGGYAIQGTGAALVAGIDGDYLNVVGFPVAAFLDLLDATPDLRAALWRG